MQIEKIKLDTGSVGPDLTMTSTGAVDTQSFSRSWAAFGQKQEKGNKLVERERGGQE